MFKPMDKKIIAILRSKILINSPYVICINATAKSEISKAMA